MCRGCHWGACTAGSSFPVQLARLRPGTVTTSWSTSQPGGSSAYDVAYDIWFNQTATTNEQPDGAELMIWLNHHGSVQPFGSEIARNVSLGGRRYNIWFGKQGWNTISYTMASPQFRSATSTSARLPRTPFAAATSTSPGTSSTSRLALSSGRAGRA
jgi:hypothetical protein